MLLSPRGSSFPSAFSPHVPPHSQFQQQPPPPSAQQHSKMHPNSYSLSGHSSPSHHYQSAHDSDPYPSAASLPLASSPAGQPLSHTPTHGHAHSHPSSFFSPSSASSPADAFYAHPSAPSPSHQWSSSGKLKAAARSIFERAYGLNGRQREDHSALCDEVMRSTACSAKSFEELIYGHSYESELSELRQLVSDYKPREAKKKERGGGRALSAAAGRKRDMGGDDILRSALSPLGRQSSASTVSSRSLLMPLYSQYPAATTPVSASRYEMAHGGSTASQPPRRKSLDANMLYGPLTNHHAHAAQHAHSSSSFISPTPSSHYASQCAHHDGDFTSAYPSSSSLTPSHGGMRHRPNFASAAAAAAAAADSVVAYVASTPTMAVLNGGWAGGVHSPNATQRESSASSAFPFTLAANTAPTTNTSSSLLPSASSPSASSFLAQPAPSPPPAASSRTTILHSPSQSSTVVHGTTLAPVTLASIKTSPPQLIAKLISLPPPSLSSASAFLSPAVTAQSASSATSDSNSRASSRSTTPQPASPALAPPRPTILIPNSPLTTDTTDDGSSSGTGINVTGGSDVVRGSGEAEDDDEEEDNDRRAQEVKAERKRRKKERRDERRGDNAKQPTREDADRSKEYVSTNEQAGGGAQSWRAQPVAVKEEKKERPNDSSRPAALTAAAAGGVSAALLPCVSSAAAPAAAERMLPFADVTPPPTIDFPPYSTPAAFHATPTLSLLKRVGASCALFTLVRLCVLAVSPVATAIDHNTALMLFLACFLASLFLVSATLSSISTNSRSALAASTAPSSSSLSSELSRYVQAWDLLALDDPQQLLAAYGMTQQMLLSLLHALQPASLTSSPAPSLSPASLLSHTQSILSFLDVAHQHLHIDTGYTLLLDRLLTAAAALRHRTLQLSATLPLRSSSSHTAMSSSTMLLQLLSGCCLVGYVVLPCPALRWSVTSAVVHLLMPAALVALEMLGLFVVLEGETRQQAGEGGDAVEVEGLLELKQRMDKRMEALMVHAAHSA